MSTEALRHVGLIAAAFTPQREDGGLWLDRVPELVEFLIGEGIRGLFLCGSTGEGALLTGDERRAVTEAYVRATAGRLPVTVMVGHASLAEARDLARHAESTGATAIAATPPTYFPPRSVDSLVTCLAQITGACGLPFYYYHIPRLTGVDLDMVEFLRLGGDRLGTLAGLKFSEMDVFGYQSCVEFDGGRFDVMYGSDETLLSGLVAGGRAAVGSTYNFAAPLYQAVLEAHERGDLAAAREAQSRSVHMVRVLLRHRGLAGIKATMGLIGQPCGPCRLPLEALRPEEVETLRQELEEIGFFDWRVARPERD